MKPARILTLLFLFAAFTAAAQGGRDAIEEQKRVIAALEKRIADEERAISKIQEGRAATEERVRRLARQLDSRNQLLEETEKQVRLLRKEISRTDSVAGDLSSALERNRTQYAEMVREAYRNYKHNNYLTYISRRATSPTSRKRSPTCARWLRCANANCTTSPHFRNRSPARRSCSTVANARWIR